jgi:hypothetical protein
VTSSSEPTATDPATTDWLLDSDPSIRWQAMRDLLDAEPEAVERERARVTADGWGARFLSLQADDGQWDAGACFPGGYRGEEEGQPWTSTYPVLAVLRLLGPDPADPAVTEAVARVAESCRWEHDNQPFFEGEVEPCINGGTVAIGDYFGVDVQGIVDRLLTEQLDDGGWNCEVENGATVSSFHTTIQVLEGLAEHQRAHGSDASVDDAMARAHEYVLARRLFRRLSSGDLADERFLDFAFPPRWRYDVLRALDHFRVAGVDRDERMSEAVGVVRDARSAEGRWLLDRAWPGRVPFEMEQVGEPSRWNTLRALRVLRWWDQT